MRRSILAALITLIFVPALHAQPTGDTPETWRVIIKPAPPFVIERSRQPDAAPAGIAIELWDRIAARLGVESSYESRDMPDLLAGIAAGEGDIGIGAISVTADREQSLDFTHPFFVSSLAIAVPVEERSPWVSVLRRLFSPTFAQVVAALVLLLFVVGAIVWLVERRRNPEQFHADPVRGLGDGLWFSAVTMTTVGYGDKAPSTPIGRVVTLVWMFAGIIVISSFTAAIASALTVSSLDTDIQSADDLPGRTVATVEGTTSDAYLLRRGIRRKIAESPAAALEMVAQGEADAAVYDRPVLEYLLSQRSPTEESGSIRLLPGGFEEQFYALALPPDAARREEVNRAILEITGDPSWSAVVARYLAGS
ncbi:MAG: transporter substrate-binding domain-containing protein [Phycisphaerales bacterium JB037]